LAKRKNYEQDDKQQKARKSAHQFFLESISRCDQEKPVSQGKDVENPATEPYSPIITFPKQLQKKRWLPSLSRKPPLGVTEISGT
jgi:hypothetical protein